MTLIFVGFFGLLPAILLSVPALLCLISGLAILVDNPDEGALLFAWAFAGLFGTHTLIQVAFGTFTDNTVPGLLAGIAAAAPLVYFSVESPKFPETLVPLLFTASPIIVATGYLADILLFESPDDARIVEYEEA